MFDLSPKLFEGPTAGQDKRNAGDLGGPFLRVGVLLSVDGIFAANVHLDLKLIAGGSSNPAPPCTA
jgi:hypothetical protein